MLMALFLQFNSPGETFVFNAASKVLSSSLKLVFHLFLFFFKNTDKKSHSQYMMTVLMPKTSKTASILN